ncbi:MAG: sodium:sulfate symporter, partial [Desulfobacterales bacterium]|nr:sodium:sulfate symporter [Desulfobacterales bacterium]
MAKEKKKRATGYDKYVNWKLFVFPVILFALVLMMPTPYGMKDVGTEYEVGPKVVVNHIVKELFNEKSTDVAQWQILTAQIMERNMRMGALNIKRFLKRDLKWCKKYKIQADSKNLER